MAIVKENETLLIVEAYVKSFSSVYDSVDPKIIRPYIFEAQNINLKYLLPVELFDDLITQNYNWAEAGKLEPVSDHIDERLIELREYAKPVLLYYTLYNAAYSLYSRITNKGIQTQDSDFSSSVELRILDSMRTDWKTKAESYGTRMLDFLNDNTDIYTEVSEACAATTAFRSPIYLGENNINLS